MTTNGSDIRPLAWMALLALGSCAGTLIAGIAAALTYTGLEPALRGLGFTIQHFRAVHETYAFAWMFLGGASVVYLYLYRAHGPLRPGIRRRFIWQTMLWAVAGVGILVTLLAGRFTGREYAGYLPVFSVLIVAGWLLFAWNFYSRGNVRLRGQPAYVYMWSVSLILFLITYTEAHLYLLEPVSQRPLRDLAIQWKSAGTMVGSFNLLAYGSLMYVSGCIDGDDSYAHSRTAFTLFFVGLLNTFMNYGHHTYHLPQSPWVHWVAFVVSMLETIILAKVLIDLVGMMRSASRGRASRVPERLLRSGLLWTFLVLVLALTISIPPLNALIHGTHVVVAHSMSAMIGIDSMILWAALAYLIGYVQGDDCAVVDETSFRFAIPVINVSLVVFVAAYLVRGAAIGWARYLGALAPDTAAIDAIFPIVMTVSGTTLAIAALWMLSRWIGALLAEARS